MLKPCRITRVKYKVTTVLLSCLNYIKVFLKVSNNFKDIKDKMTGWF